MKHRLRGAVVSALFLVFAIPVSAHGATGRQMSFEEVVPASDLIVVGEVVRVPELAEYDPRTHEVFKRNVVRALEYLKGDGPPEIVVLTLGGSFRMPGEPRLQEMAYGGEPSLPGVGTKALFFLKRFGPSGDFMLYTATHGVRAVQPKFGQQEECARIVLRDVANMTPATQQAYHQLQSARGEASEVLLVPDCVPVNDLRRLVERSVRNTR